MNDTELYSVAELLRSMYPDKTIVDISEVENEQHQTYKYLYESQMEKLSEQTEEAFHLRLQLMDLEKEIINLNDEIQVQKSINEKLNITAENIVEFIKRFSEQEIIVSNVRTFEKSGKEILINERSGSLLRESISDNPGVYDGKRPNWFKALSLELSQTNMKKKSAEKTKHILSDKLSFWKSLVNALKSKEVTLEEAQTKLDLERKAKILELLDSDSSNYEKYLKYYLLTPGLPKHYMKTLTGAAELGLDANVIIELLEQPIETFNREIIEIYVSETHKATDFNLKKELACELIRGDWYVTADINGDEQKFQMVPLVLLEELNEKLGNISLVLSDLMDEQLCANLAQSDPDNHRRPVSGQPCANLAQSNLDNFPDEQDDYEIDGEYSFIDFDDSLI